MDSSAYFEHLSETDLNFLATVARTGGVTGLQELLRERPEQLHVILESDDVYRSLFASRVDSAQQGAGQPALREYGPLGYQEAMLRASPFLIFSVLIARAHQELQSAAFVQEWVGPSRRVPVFEVATLRRFSAGSDHRLFLAELLASYTRVASGSFWVHTARGWRRRRYSELDLMRLVELLNVVPESERGALFRRLGDLSLFLSGVFPDYTGSRLFRPMQRKRLRGAVAGEGGEERKPETSDDSSGISFLESIGSASYRQASIAAERTGGSASALRDISGEFGQARRVLNFMTDRYLFPFRDQWFTVSEN